ncbi:MAG: leucyl aminopeptidase family protein [Fimbriimonadaceae bacterium]
MVQLLPVLPSGEPDSILLAYPSLDHAEDAAMQVLNQPSVRDGLGELNARLADEGGPALKKIGYLDQKPVWVLIVDEFTDQRIALEKAADALERIAGLDCERPLIFASPRLFEIIGEAAELRSWNKNLFPGSAAREETYRTLEPVIWNEDSREAYWRGVRTGTAENFARTLAQTPPNVATPFWMAEVARELAQKNDLIYSVLRFDELAENDLTGLINVGKASENPPCLVRLEYRPTEGFQKTVVLIGKTITYDTGGLSLKTRDGMVGMKVDKSGGCAVLGAMQLLAQVIRPDVRVVALLAAAENTISDEAYKPDDVLRFRNGVTVEVTNTDAEGRLVLADALCWACDQEQADCILDIATLTGGIVTALGDQFAGLFCTNPRLQEHLVRIGDATGEPLWPMPLTEGYRDMMRSEVADIVNSAKKRTAHPVQGAAFLSYFVDKNIPWAHIDIAGTATTDRKSAVFEAGPTGFGTKLLAQAASTF